MRLIHLDTIALKVSLSTLSPPMDSRTARSGFLDLNWYFDKMKNALWYRYCLPENFQIWGKLVWQSDSAVRINGNIFIKQVGAGTRINAARGLFTLVVTKNLQEKPPSWKWIIVKIAQYLLPWLRQAVWTTTWENIVCLNKMQFPLQNQRFARDNMSNYTHGKYLRNIQIWILPCASRGRLASEMSRNDLYIFFVSSHLKLIW